MSRDADGVTDGENGQSIDVDTDELGHRILQALWEVGGQGLGTEVRDAMGGVDTGIFNYRIRNHLEPSGAVVSQQVETDENHLPPKELTLTDAGKEYLKQLDSTPHGDTGVSERLDELESEIESLRDENQELRDLNHELQEKLDRSNLSGAMEKLSELERDVESVQGNISDVEGAVQEIESRTVIQSGMVPAAINGGVVLGNTCKKLLEEELGEQRVEDKRQEVKSLLKDDGSLVGDG